jgi:pentalenic acid synthase
MTETTAAQDIPEREALSTFPHARVCPFQPSADHELLQRERGTFMVDLPSGQKAWLLTRQPDVRSALDDPRLSSDMSRDNFPVLRAQAVTHPSRAPSCGPTVSRTCGSVAC